MKLFFTTENILGDQVGFARYAGPRRDKKCATGISFVADIHHMTLANVPDRRQDLCAPICADVTVRFVMSSRIKAKTIVLH